MNDKTNPESAVDNPTTVNKLEYLKMIQDIIIRMANNSFHLKGWAITIVTGIFAVSAWNNLGVCFYSLIYIPIVSFWFLDTYYLQQERLYRGLYDRVRNMDDTTLYACNYSMIPPLKKNKRAGRDKDDPDYKRDKYPFYRVMFSITESSMYIPFIVLITIIIILMAGNSETINTDIANTVTISQ